MVRIGISFILALSMGWAVGAFWAHQRLAPDLVEALDERDALRTDNTALREKLEESTPRLERLDEENEALNDQVNSLLAALEDSQSLEAEDFLSGNPRDASARKSFDEVRDEEPATEEAPQSTSFQEFLEANPEAVEAMQRRRANATQRREWFDAFMEEQAANAADTQTATRIAMLAEYQRYLSDLRRELAGAESEEERADIAAVLREAGQDLRDLLREQQDDMFRAVAEAHGITDEEEQAALTREVRDVMRSPFFSMPWAFGSGASRARRGRPAGP